MSQVIEGYDAILVKGQPRFRKDRKMVAAAVVPENIKTALQYELANPPAVLEVPPAPADIQNEIGQNEIEAEEVSSPVRPILVQEPTEPAQEGAEFAMPSEYEMQLAAQLEDVRAQLVERAATKTALSMNDLATQLYERFGIYTAFSNVPPQLGDLHPFTGKPMNRYEMGLAYQGWKFATNSGAPTRDLESEHIETQVSREAIQMQVDEMERRKIEPNFDVPKYQSFAERTSVEGQKQASTRLQARPNDPISEDITAEPVNGVRGQTIRPEW